MEYSEKLVEVLTELSTNEDPVADFLLELNNTEQEYQTVDLSQEVGKISFIKEGEETKRKIKSGRFVAKFTDEFTARQIELFVNEFKSFVELNKIKDNIELGCGEDFDFAYTRDNYSEISGSLGGSCMNNAGEVRLKLYRENPRKIKILMVKDEEGKLVARAILWKNGFLREGESAEDRNNSESFKASVLDRVYATQDHYINTIHKYAQEQGWYIRLGGLSFRRPDGETVNCRVKFNLKSYEYGNYPYLDTMRSISKKGTISNKRWKGEVRFW